VVSGGLLALGSTWDCVGLHIYETGEIIPSSVMAGGTEWVFESNMYWDISDIPDNQWSIEKPDKPAWENSDRTPALWTRE
jgi:hypothetical protein